MRDLLLLHKLCHGSWAWELAGSCRATLESTFGLSTSWTKAHSPVDFYHISSEVGAIHRLKPHFRCKIKSWSGHKQMCAVWGCQIAYLRETTRMLSHLLPQLQDAALKHSPDALKRDRKMAMRRGKWGGRWGAVPPPFLSSSEYWGWQEERQPPPPEESWALIKHLFGRCSDHQKPEDTLKWSSIDV